MTSRLAPAWEDFEFVLSGHGVAADPGGTLNDCDELQMCDLLVELEATFDCAPLPVELVESLETWADLFGFIEIKSGTSNR